MFTRLLGFGRSKSAAGPGDAAAESALQRVAPLDPLQTGAGPDDLFEVRWRGPVRRRVLIVLCALGLWTAVVEARLVHLQVLRHQEMLTLAIRQQKKEVKLLPPRGDIVVDTAGCALGRWCPRGGPWRS
jgi:hypothetical protein